MSNQFHKIRALAAQGLPVQSRDVRALLEAYDKMQADYKHAMGDLEAEVWRLKGGEWSS